MAFVGFQKKPFTEKFKDIGELDKIYRCLSELRKDYDKLSKEGKQQLDFLTNYFAILEQNDYDNTRK